MVEKQGSIVTFTNVHGEAVIVPMATIVRLYAATHTHPYEERQDDGSYKHIQRPVGTIVALMDGTTVEVWDGIDDVKRILA